MVKFEKLVVLEFSDEAAAYQKTLGSENFLDNRAVIVSLNPSARCYLKNLGVESEHSVSYFNAESHACAIRSSEKISDWIRGRVRFVDSFGISFSYVESVAWYILLIIHHCIWGIEVLSQAIAKHNPSMLQVGISNLDDMSGHRLQPNQRYLGALAERLTCASGVRISFLKPRINYWKTVKWRYGRLAKLGIVRTLALPFAHSYLQRLDAQASNPPILLTTNNHQMNDVAYRLSEETGKPLIMLGNWPDWHSKMWGNSSGCPSSFQNTAWLGVLDNIAPENYRTRLALAESLDQLAVSIEGASDIFLYKGVTFADLIARKLREGIKPFMLALHRRAASLQVLLKTMKPCAVISAGDRDEDMFIGELCRMLQIPALMISHGSHVAPRNDLERYEWGGHSSRMIRAPYSSVALQSPLAEEFLKTLPASGTMVRTGPLVWGKPADQVRSKKLRQQMILNDSVRYVVVHCGTTKMRSSRFHVYETPDEYVQSISELVAAVECLPDVHLVIKFRPILGLTINDLRSLVRFSEKISLNVEDSFLDVLGLADLLVSFSSTAIEEALQNDVPVLLFGADGRYQHVPAVELRSGMECPMAAAYFVKHAEDLSVCLANILTLHSGLRSREYLFHPYKFKKSDCQPLSDILSLGTIT